MKQRTFFFSVKTQT